VPLKLLTWNIQAAIGTARFSDYLTRAHRQVFHTQAKASTLETIAETIRGADLVCLQEVDLGGRRAGYRCQANAIAERSGHDHLAIQENRVIRGVSRHGNAILSRHPLSNIRDLKLPGRVAGRGCLIATVEADKRLTWLASISASEGAIRRCSWSSSPGTCRVIGGGWSWGTSIAASMRALWRRFWNGCRHIPTGSRSRPILPGGRCGIMTTSSPDRA
jgi:hypothetical protein